MEFLGDLLSQQEPETTRPDGQASGQAATESSPSSSEPKPVSAGDGTWEELRSGIPFDEPEVESVKLDKKHRSGLKLWQKAILGGLGLAALVAWGLVAMLFFFHSTTDRATAPTTDLEQSSTVAVTPSPRMETPRVGGVTGGTHPTATPTVVPTVPTRFDHQIELDPTNIELRLRRGREYLRIGAYKAAENDFNTALRLDENQAEAYVGLGWAYFYLWQWDKAQDAFNEALTLEPTTIEAYLGLGKLHFYRGEYEEAALAYDQAAELNPQDAEAEAWLGISAAKLGDAEEARGAVTRAKAQNDTLAIVFIAQSWARRVQTPPDIDGAQADLLYAHSLDPNSFVVLNALAEFYVDWRPERLGEAEQLAVYAHEWAKNDIERAVALHTLGRVYLAQGRKADAQKVLGEAAAMATMNGQTLLPGLQEDLARAQE